MVLKRSWAAEVSNVSVQAAYLAMETLLHNLTRRQLLEIGSGYRRQMCERSLTQPSLRQAFAFGLGVAGLYRKTRLIRMNRWKAA